MSPTEGNSRLAPLDVSIHLGAHKTATTYMQSVLALNIVELAKLGVAYIPLARMRESLTRQLWSPSPDNLATARAELRNRVTDVAPAPRRLVLSDENLLGTPTMDLMAGAFYPRVTAHLLRLSELLGDTAEPSLFLAVRSYDRFLPAMYAEALRHREFLGFDEYVSRLAPDAMSWLDVVAAICDAVAEDRLTLWQYEEFGALERAVLNAIVPEASKLEFVLPEEPVVRPSPCGRAMQVLTALRGVLTASEVQRLVEPVYENVTDGAPFEPFAEHESEKLQSRYAADLAHIRNDFPRVRWLRPASDGDEPDVVARAQDS